MAFKIKFFAIDSWNRPVFKSESGQFYGATDKLFEDGTTEEKVLETVTEEDITWFGLHFDCEPMGNNCYVKIVKHATGG